MSRKPRMPGGGGGGGGPPLSGPRRGPPFPRGGGGGRTASCIGTCGGCGRGPPDGGASARRLRGGRFSSWPSGGPAPRGGGLPGGRRGGGPGGAARGASGFRRPG